MELLGSPFLLAAVCAYTYYALGTHDSPQNGRGIGLLWAILSLVVSLFVCYVCGRGWTWILLSQVMLYFGIALFRAVRQG